MGVEKTTLGDVANLAGVSVSTVSRILAGGDTPFSETTRERVKNAADKLGYRPSKLARGLIRSQTGIVGLVVPSIQDSFFPSVTAAIEKELAGHGINVILSNTSADSEIEKAKIHDLLDWCVDGLIIAPAQETGDAGLFWDLTRRNIPFVLIDRSFPDTPFFSVTTDDFSGAEAAVEHLISTGRRRIAQVGSSPALSTTRERHEGYAEALIRNGILPDKRLMIEVPPTREGGRKAFAEMMSLDPRPDAAFCFTDLIAIGIMDECLKSGIRIPEDLSIVGYADLPQSDMLSVPLTTVRQPCELLGKRAAQMLLAQMEGESVEKNQEKLAVELVIRKSTEV